MKFLTEKGTVLRRNRRHLLKTKETFEKDRVIDYDRIVINYANRSQIVPSTSNFAKEPVLPEQVEEPERAPFYRTRYGRQAKPPSKLILYTIHYGHCSTGQLTVSPKREDVVVVESHSLLFYALAFLLHASYFQMT